ncbi:MAG: tetratricopeptide repeat protein [Ktedonobacteraceae bacterium]
MQQPSYFTFGIQATTSPATGVRVMLSRTDEVNAIVGHLRNPQVRTVLITGAPGVGKSTLAAFIFGLFQGPLFEGTSDFHRYIWLRPGPHTTWPDIIATLLNALETPEKHTGQISQRADLQTLYETLSLPGQGTLIVLDQCEELFERAIEKQNTATPYTVGIGLSSSVRFLEMLQQDLGESRVLLTCTKSPYGSDYSQTPGIREHNLGGVTIVEGIHLLQQRNVMGLQQDLSMVWQRCSGHAHSLLMFSVLKNLSGLSLHYLLNSPLYQILWDGNIAQNLVEAVVSFLNPVQMSQVRALCLFREPISLAGIIEIATGEKARQETDNQLFEQEINNLVALGLVEQIGRYDGETGYLLHTILNQYLLSHYLESEQRKANSYASSSLGVANQPSPLQVDEEAGQVAVAAGHMRVASYYQHVAQQICPPYPQRTHPNEITPWLAMLEHLCLGWHWQMAYDQLTALGLDEELVRWEVWHTLIRLYEMMLPPVGSLQRQDEGLVCGALGMLYGRIGEREQSRTYYTSALAIQRDMGDQQSEALTLTNQGEFLRSLGEIEPARKNFEQAMNQVQPQSNPELTCVLMHNMGLLEQQRGEYQQSTYYFMQSLHIAQQDQNSAREGMILTNIGLLLCEQQRYADGLALLLPALQMRQARHDPGTATLLAFLEKLEQRMGNNAFANLRQVAQVEGKQEQVLRILAN